MKRACIIPAFLDYNMLVVNFKGMEEELFLCEGGEKLTGIWEVLCGTRKAEQGSFSAGMGDV